MYHISSDARAQGSARRIGEGMLRCLKKMPFQQITVSELQRESGVGRSTFYRLFDNTADVLDHLCNQIFERADRSLLGTEQPSATEMTLTFIRLWMQDRDLLQGMIDSGRMDVLQSAHMRNMAKHPQLLPPELTEDPVQLHYLTAALASCTAAFLTAWLQSGATEEPEMVQRRITRCAQTLCGIFAQDSEEANRER